MNKVGGGREESAMAAPTLLSASGAEVPERLGEHWERLKVKSIKTKAVAQILFKACCVAGAGVFWVSMALLQLAQ